ncbi:unnamed protein product [Rangifer tarandus platyrhynchus]|uniref:Uncharacterized protein n=2 Tax=Rangifer tarandus platyrhynchus TaxID=3082113 RepID=A0ABN8Z875_RANTA|nr:unnamed protein product [Rangifer tarandus platyrhynchus]
MRPSRTITAAPSSALRPVRLTPQERGTVLSKALNCASNLTRDLACEPVSSRSKAHGLAGFPGAEVSAQAKARGMSSPTSCVPHYPLPHPVWITWSEAPDFGLPPRVTCSCEQAVLGRRARCPDRPASPSLHTSHMPREGWTSSCTSSLGPGGESFLSPYLG